MAMDVPRPDLKKARRRRQMMIGGVVFAALAGMTWAISSLEPAAREVDRTQVWTSEVKRGEFLRSVRGSGTLVPEEIRWIAAETEGQVERILIDPGAEVEADSIVLRLSDPVTEQSAQDAALALKAADARYTDLVVSLESQVLDQEANLARVKADYQTAMLKAESNKELFSHQLISEIDLKSSDLMAEQLKVRYEIEQKRIKKFSESMSAKLAVERNSLEQARALHDLRQARLASLDVRAGISGVLQQVPVEEGQRVTPGTNLARVAQPERLKAEIRIAETQAKDVLFGQAAEIDTRNGKITGKVVRIDPAVNQGTVTVEVRLEGELPKGARPDLSVEGVIELERLDDVIQMSRPTYGQPYSTLGLFKVSEDGRTAELTQVKVGRWSTNYVEVLEGLKEGDEVVLNDSSKWGDATRIRLK